MCCVSTVRAAGDLQSQPSAPFKVLAVEIQGLDKVPESEVRNLIKVRAGDLVTQKAIDRDVKRLWSSRAFSHVQYHKERLEDGWKLMYILTESQLLGEVKFVHVKRFSEKKLKEETGLIPGTPLGLGRLFRAQKTVEELYHRAGYQFVQVTRETYDTPTGTGVRFIIQEGPRVRVRRVELVGNQTFSTRKLRKQIRTKPYRFILNKGLFDPEVLADDLARIRTRYRSQGFFDVQLDHHLKYSEARSELVVVIQIDEKSRYLVDHIILDGVKLFAKDEIRDRLSSREGKPYSEEAYLDDQETIRDFYGNRGFVLATVRPEISLLEEPPGRLNLIYHVNEGERIFIEKVEITGNYKTKSQVIRRELNFHPGEQFNRAKLKRSRERLLNTRFFSSVNMPTEPGTTPHQRNLLIEVEEAQTGQFVFGGAWSDYGLIGQFEFSQRNFDWRDWPEGVGDFFQGTAFAGAGQHFRLSLQPGTDFTQLNVSFEEPWLFGHPNSLGLEGWRREIRRWDYEEIRTGGQLSLGRRLRPDLSMRLFFKTEDIRITDIGTDAPLDVFKVKGRHTINSIGLAAALDKRDSFVLPTRGYRISGTYEYAGALTGGDVDLHRVQLEARKYHTLFETNRGKYILMTAGSAGLVKPLDDTREVPFFERMYAGGTGSVRGFDIRGLGPHDRDEPIGGELKIIGNLELNYPIYKETIRGVVFYDVGEVVPESGDLNISEFRSSIGAGIRLTMPTPFGPLPLSFDLGFPIDPEPEDEIRHFNFRMGALF